MSRGKATLIHFLISAAVGLCVSGLLFGVWYPPPFFRAAGGDQLIVLLLGVDLALGPLLTFILFRPGKRGLKFDLTVVGALQIVALTYGLFIILESRPIFLVAAVDRFVLIAANEISDADLAEGYDVAFRSRSWTGPRLAAIQMPVDPKERTDLAFSALGGRDAENMPKYYRDYSIAGKTLLAKAKPLDTLPSLKGVDRNFVADLARKMQLPQSSIVWVPLQARKSDMVMLLNATTAAPLAAINIDPWAS